MLKLKNLGYIETKFDPRVAETLRQIESAINLHGTIAGIDPTGVFKTPPAPSQLLVVAVAGGFDISIIDADPQRGVYYFLDFATLASFKGARTVPLVTVRNVYLPLVQGTYFFRAYSQFRGSDPSPYAYFGGTVPASVTGGAAGTPVLGGSQGTGARGPKGGSPNPPVGSGFGPIGKLPPPRNVPGGRFQDT